MTTFDYCYTQANNYVQKPSIISGLSNGVSIGGCSYLYLLPGQYEFKFSVDNVLVKLIPFEFRKDDKN